LKIKYSITRNKVLYGLYRYLIGFLLKPIINRQINTFLSRKMVNERPLEYAFLLKHLSQIYPKTILDVGTGASALPHVLANCGFDVTATDEKGSYWGFDFFNHHYPVIEDDIKNSKLTKKFDFISCISVLEHIPEADEAVKGLFDLLEPNGYLLVTFPFNKNDFVENVYKLEGAGYGQNAPFICQLFSQKEVNNWLKDNGGTIIEQNYYEIFTGEFWTFGEKLYPPRQVDENSNHHLTCILIQKNYSGMISEYLQVKKTDRNLFIFTITKTSPDELFAWYILKEGVQIDKIWYDPNPVLNYTFTEPGKYQIKYFVKKNKNKKSFTSRIISITNEDISV
jgi:SAM-dependent methyltransferase